MCDETIERAALSVAGSTRHGRGDETIEASRQRIEKRIQQLDADEETALDTDDTEVLQEIRVERSRLGRELAVIEEALR